MSEETEGKKLKEKLFNKKENGWLSVDSEKEKVMFQFSDEYIYFLNKGKTERECCSYWNSKIRRRNQCNWCSY